MMTFSKRPPAPMTTEDVMKALGRYTSEAKESDQHTAAMLGIKRATLRAWLDGGDSPQKRGNFILRDRRLRFGVEDRWGESAPNDYLLDQFRMSAPRLWCILARLAGFLRRTGYL
jgi:hypothetical protein